MPHLLHIRTLERNGEVPQAALIEHPSHSVRPLNKLNAPAASFRHAKLIGADLEAARLMRSDFSDADLTAASLEMARANYAWFVGASFVSANLQEAKFQDVNLANANMEGAVIRFANFNDVNFDGCESCPVDW